MSIIITEALQIWQEATHSTTAPLVYQKSNLPVQALEICGCLTQQKINHQFYNGRQKSEKQLLGKLKTNAAGKLIITVSHCNWHLLMRFIKNIRQKKQWNTLTIIICGENDNLPAKQLLETGVDFICPKYAAVSVVKLIQALDTPMNPFLDKVPGIVFKNMLGKYCVQPKADTALYKEMGVWTNFEQKGLKSLLPKHIMLYSFYFSKTNVIKPLDVIQAELSQLSQVLPKTATIAYWQKDYQYLEPIKNLPKNAELLVVSFNKTDNHKSAISIVVECAIFAEKAQQIRILSKNINRLYLTYNKKPRKKVQKNAALQLLDWPKSKLYICESGQVDNAMPLVNSNLQKMLNYRKYLQHLHSGSYNIIREILYFMRSV